MPWLVAEVSNVGDKTEPPRTPARKAAWDDLLRLAHGDTTAPGESRAPVRVNDGTPGAKRQKVVEDKLLAYVIGQEPNGRKVSELRFGPRAGASGDRAETLDRQTVKLINLVRQWLTSLVPHVLSKRVNVEFGLLPREAWVNSASEKKRSRAKTMGRKLLAVPYVGKDSPSEAAEFSSPDVIIGFTILAYAYEGLRKVDVAALLTGPRNVVALGGRCEFDSVADRPAKEFWGDRMTKFRGLSDEFKSASGPIHDRPAYKQYNDWVAAGFKAHAARALEARQGGGDGDSDDERDGDRDDADAIEPWVQPVPLDLIDKNNADQMDAAHSAISQVKAAIGHYLSVYIFPRCLKYHRTKLQASGLDLGSNVLFDTRLGFSGAPPPPSNRPARAARRLLVVVERGSSLATHTAIHLPLLCRHAVEPARAVARAVRVPVGHAGDRARNAAQPEHPAHQA